MSMHMMYTVYDVCMYVCVTPRREIREHILVVMLSSMNRVVKKVLVL